MYQFEEEYLIVTRADLIFLNVRCKECTTNISEFWGGMHFPGLLLAAAARVLHFVIVRKLKRKDYKNVGSRNIC
jgi:hypothetical protein